MGGNSSYQKPVFSTDPNDWKTFGPFNGLTHSNPMFNSEFTHKFDRTVQAITANTRALLNNTGKALLDVIKQAPVKIISDILSDEGDFQTSLGNQISEITSYDNLRKVMEQEDKKLSAGGENITGGVLSDEKLQEWKDLDFDKVDDAILGLAEKLDPIVKHIPVKEPKKKRKRIPVNTVDL